MRMTLPNQLTALRILLTPVFVWLILSDSPMSRLFGIVVFTIASLTDLYDGYHARKYGETTRWGAFMDPLADKILITATFLVFVSHDIVELWMVIVVLLRDVIVTALRLYAELKDKPVITSKSAKLKTLFQNVLAYILLLCFFFTERMFFGDSFSEKANALLYSQLVWYAMLALTIFTVYTGGSYIVENWRTVRGAYLGIRDSVNAHG
jgi:CDP-diacylglycerol---glycerol-3-phosphate 3-phosphatidyltransferase